MSFVMIATGATSRSRVRTLSLPGVTCGAVTLAALVFGAGGGAGYWLAQTLPAASAAVGAPVAAPPARSLAALPFTLEQLGAISARLFRLESQASQLGKRIGVLQKDASPAEARPAAVEPSPASKARPGQGGPMLPPRATASDPVAIEAQIARLEDRIHAVAEATSQRNVDAMRLPTRWPVQHAEMSSPFGNRSDPLSQHPAFHAGLDFAAGTGTPILAAAGG
ncbi:MAG: hypothetical protein ABIX46_09450, partial [Burkholderiaceae bacterium]